MRFLLLLMLLAITLLVAHGEEEDSYEEEESLVTYANCKKEAYWQGRVLGSLPDYHAKTLSLQGCNLTEFSGISGLPNVYIIYIAINNIQHIDPTVFDLFPKLTMLHLDSNKLREVPAFGEHATFPNVTFLDLSKNLITKLDNPRTFSSKLQTIILDCNPIEYVHPETFKELPDLDEIRLFCTKIKTIPSTMFQYLPAKLIDLSFNLIEYVPPHSFNGTKLRELHLEGNGISYLPVGFLSELKAPGAVLDIYFFYNHWHCSCFLEFLAEVKKSGVRYRSFYLFPDENKPACVYVGAKCDRDANSSMFSSSVLSVFPPKGSPRTYGYCGKCRKEWDVKNGH